MLKFGDHLPYLKINSDAAFDSSTSKGNFGVICRDEKGNLLTSSSNYLFATSALVAEALALRGVTLLGQNLCLDSVIFGTNCLVFVQACRKEQIVKENEGILNDIWFMSSSFQHVGFTLVCRDGNHVAHTIASLPFSGLLTGNWFKHPPPSLREALVRDKRLIVGH